MKTAVGPHAEFTHARMPRAPLVPNHTIDAASAGTAPSHRAPVQSIFTSWRTLNTTNTESGTRADKRMNNQRRRASGASTSSGVAAPRVKRETNRVRTPVGVSRTSTEMISLWRANRGASASRRDVWNANDAHSCCAFHKITGEKMTQAMITATYGSHLASQRRDRGSRITNSTIAGTSIPMVYLEIRPMPMLTPASSQARDWPAISARSRKYNVAAHAAVMGASGVMSIPARKKNGSTCINTNATRALGSPNRLRVSRYAKNDATAAQHSALIRTPNS